MDKYEYKLKLEQLRNLAAAGDDSTAAKIADSINWKRVRSVSTLCLVGDIYSRLGRYDNSREMYLLAYDRSPIGRNIVYKLTETAIKAQNVEEAEDYYNEFAELAVNDTKKYVLRYRISELKKEPVENRISILEEFKEREYSEEWAYELARLYEQAGDSARCVEACDELILWFGDGEYVEKALLMKRRHQVLTGPQEEKYREILRKRGRAKSELPEPEEEPAAGTAPAESAEPEDLSMGRLNQSPEKEQAQASGMAAVEEGIPQTAGEKPMAAVTEEPAAEQKKTAVWEEPKLQVLPEPAVLNTEELEKELRRSMQQIMSATAKDTVSDTMDTIKKMVGDFPKLQEEEPEPAVRVNEKILNKQIDRELDSDFQEFLAEDTDGQLSMEVPTSPLIEEQVPGQLSIEEVLAEWEKTRRAAEAALAVAEQKKLEVAKRKAIEEAKDLIRRLQKLEEEPVFEEIPGPELPKEEKTGPTADAKSTEPLGSEPDRKEEERAAEKTETLPETEVPVVEASQPDGLRPEEEPEVSVKETGSEAEPQEEESEEPAKETGSEAEPQEEEPEEPAKETGSEAEPQEEEPAKEAGSEAGPQEEESEEPAKEAGSEAEPREEEPSKEIGSEAEPQASEPSREEIAANLAMMEEITRIAKEATDIKGILKGETAQQETAAAEGTEEHLREEAPEEKPEGSTLTARTQEIPVIVRAGIPMESGEDMTEETAQPQPEVTEEEPGKETEAEKSGGQTESEEEKEESGKAAESEEELARKIEPEEFTDSIVLSKEQKQLFSYFLPVPGMEEQICSVLTGCLSRGRTITSITGNIIIQGPEGSGKTVLAASLIKCIQMKSGETDKKIGKISAKALNKKDFAALIPKLDGGYVIIEKAGDLLPETMERMAQVMEGNTRGLVVVMEDSKSRINHLLKQNFGFARKFTEKITIPVFTIDELVDFGKSYAEEMECVIDEMGVLALYNRINNIQKLDRATTLTEVREIVDQAIESAEGGGIKKAFGVLFSKKYNENDYLILREKDFEL